MLQDRYFNRAVNLTPVNDKEAKIITCHLCFYNILLPPSASKTRKLYYDYIIHICTFVHVHNVHVHSPYECICTTQFHKETFVTGSVPTPPPPIHTHIKTLFAYAGTNDTYWQKHAMAQKKGGQKDNLSLILSGKTTTKKLWKQLSVK
jgi:hypothetical protein